MVAATRTPRTWTFISASNSGECCLRLGERRLEAHRFTILRGSPFAVASCFSDLPQAEMHPRRPVAHLQQSLELRLRDVELFEAHREAGQPGARLRVGSVRADRR